MCSTQSEAVVWYDDSIAIVIEEQQLLDYDPEAMARIVTFFHRLYDKSESITGLTNLPLDSPWQDRITIQIPLDNCGAAGLASHGVRGISVGQGEFIEQYAFALNNENTFLQVFFYESNRNFWLPAFNDYIDWAMNDEIMNWGWWTVGMNNAMAVIMPELLEVEMDYGWRQQFMPWDTNESINDLMSDFLIYSFHTWGGENWLRGFYQSINTVPFQSDVFAYQAYRNNIYRIWSDAAGLDLKSFFTNDLRWNITVDLETPKEIPVKYSLADAIAGGDGNLPGTGNPGISVIHSLNNQNYSGNYSIIDGAFVPQSEGNTVISITGLQFDFSQNIALSQHDGAPSKGPSVHSDPSLQTNNLGTNPDYSGDPDNHAFIDMHATVGVTYSLDKIRTSFDNNITFNQFTARFGKTTDASINYWVLLDGVVAVYGELLTGEPEAQDVGIEISESNHYLTLVIGEANSGSINNANGFIGDPILHTVQ